MNRYIDAEKLIERLEEMKRAEYENCGGVNSKTSALQEVQELIDSIQQEQPEVDLNKEIEKWFDVYGEIWENGEWSTNDIRCTARHFYELGKKARKV